MSGVPSLPQPYLLFLGDTTEPGYAKTAFGLRDWARERCIGEYALAGATVSTGLPPMTPAQAYQSGAAELLSPDADRAHFDVIEGQGSLSHPAYAGVSLALLHGSQPDIIVACHAHGRSRMLGFPDVPVPSVEDTIELALHLGARTNPAIRCAGVSLNSAGLDEIAAAQVMAEMSVRLGLPVADPMRGGEAFARLVEECLR